MLELHDQEALELITAHRRWLFNDRRGKRADLSLRTLRGLDLHGVDLTRAKMTGAQFINCNLDGAILVEADLFGVNLTGTSFRRANCNHADFRGAILSAADFTEAKLMGCDFRDGTLLVSIAGTVAPPEMEKGSVSGTKMMRADLAGAKLHHAVIKRTDLSAAVLRNADLSDANLAGSSLKDADLRGANLTNCDLSRTLLNRAIVDGANMSGVVLRDANVFNVDFAKAAYIGALNLQESISVDDSEEAAAAIADQITAHEDWVETSGAKGARADFMGRDLSAVNFSGRTLTGAVFTDCRLARGAVRPLPHVARHPVAGGCDRRQLRRRGLEGRRPDRRNPAPRGPPRCRPPGADRDLAGRHHPRMAGARRQRQVQRGRLHRRRGHGHAVPGRGLHRCQGRPAGSRQAEELAPPCDSPSIRVEFAASLPNGPTRLAQWHRS